MQHHRTVVPSKSLLLHPHSHEISPTKISIPPNNNPPLLTILIPTTFSLNPRIPLHHSLHPLNRNLLTPPINTRNITISALTHSMRTRLSTLMLPRTNCANFGAGAIDREMRPGY